MLAHQLSNNKRFPKTWKEKATTRRMNIKQLQKRLKELTLSRDTWKLKATARQATIKELQEEIRQLRQQIHNSKKTPRNAPKLRV